MSINNVVLTGRLTKDVELRATPSGANVCSFSLAVEDFNGKESFAYFIECVAWNKTAEFISKYCGKGSMVGVVGKLTTRSYDRKDGTKAYVTEVVCNQVQPLQSKKVEEKEQPKEQDDNFFTYEDLSDLPF